MIDNEKRKNEIRNTQYGNLHPSDAQINEYVDGQLGVQEVSALESHLGACQPCRDRFAALQALFSDLASLPEVALQRDLSGGVLAAIRPKAVLSRGLKWGVAVQTATALIILAVITPVFLRAAWFQDFSLIHGQVFELIRFRFSQVLALLSAEALSAVRFLSQTATRLPQLADFHLPKAAVWPLFLSALLLWLVGNGLVLRRIARNGHRA